MNPNISSQVGLPTQSLASGSGTVSFVRNLSATDVTFLVQASNDMVSWTDLATRSAFPVDFRAAGGNLSPLIPLPEC